MTAGPRPLGDLAAARAGDPADAARPEGALATGATATPDAFGVAGAPWARLLAGPPRADGAEGLASHRHRLGPLPLGEIDPAALRAEVAASGLSGRGGGQFPLAAKLDLAAASPGNPLVVVNAAEGEPASRKDRTLLALRPHLVLDGALAAAHAVGAGEVVVYLHRSRRPSTAALEAAIAERGPTGVRVRLVDAPARYVAGESSAAVSYLEGNGALPRRRRIPVAAAGVAGRPTVVANAETVAHLALVARFGAGWFRTAGSLGEPGSTLVTLAGEVAVPGLVVEVVAPVSIGRLLGTVGGLDAPPRAVLVGGYEGTWIDGEVAWRTPLDRNALARSGAALGCGLVAVLGEGSCGLATTARLVSWLAGQSAGQCGTCVYGLPELAGRFEDVAAGGAHGHDVRRLHRLAASLRGRGACGHPTGVAGLVESALDTFADDLRLHRRARPCTPVVDGFPIPDPREAP